MPSRGSPRSQHASTSPSSAPCQLPPCLRAPVKVPHPCLQGWTKWFPPTWCFIAPQLWYSYPFQAPIRTVQLRLTPTRRPQLCCQGRAKAAHKACAQLWFPHSHVLITRPAEWLVVQNPLFKIFFFIIIIFIPPPGGYCISSPCLNSSSGRVHLEVVSSAYCAFLLRHRRYFRN